MPTAENGPAAFAGANVAGTGLAGNYGTTHDARLVTPEFIVPAAVQAPRFAYHYWYAIGAFDFCQLQIRPVGRDWQDIAAEHLIDTGGAWARRSVDLRAFGGQSVQLAFWLVSEYQARGAISDWAGTSTRSGWRPDR